jgi:predicted  nucleic acid-binding Zn-ribbon protein
MAGSGSGGGFGGFLRPAMARWRDFTAAPVLDEINALRAGHSAASVALGRVTPELAALRERQDRIEPALDALHAGQEEVRDKLAAVLAELARVTSELGRATDEIALMRDRNERAEAAFAALRETWDRTRETLAVELELGQDRLQIVLDRMDTVEQALRDRSA